MKKKSKRQRLEEAAKKDQEWVPALIALMISTTWAMKQGLENETNIPRITIILGLYMIMNISLGVITERLIGPIIKSYWKQRMREELT